MNYHSIGECRVAITPPHVVKLKKAGALIKIEKGAGELSGFSDALYTSAGAEIVDGSTVWKSELIAKVYCFKYQNAPLLLHSQSYKYKNLRCIPFCINVADDNQRH